MPAEAKISGSEYFGFHSYYKSEGHLEVTEMILNPDHDALGSFIPDDIKNGARAYIVGFTQIRYTWQDGKVVDKNGKVVLDFSEKIKVEGKKEKQSR